MISTKKGQEAYSQARQIIPGGTQLLSKRPEMFLPGYWPSYYENAKGICITDLDGNTFKDFSIGGVGSTVLGYSDPEINEAVIKAIKKGSMSTLNAPEEILLAKELIKIHPWAEMVRFSRTGGEAMAIAVRIARAHTERSKIAFCGYHGWHDWYLSANLAEKKALDGHLLAGLEPSGVPKELRGTSKPFHHNNLLELEKIIEANGKDLAAIVIEPARNELPKKEFLDNAKELAKSVGAVVIYDEITSGFRLCHGGIHKILDINPDICVLAKALGNGYPIAATIGKKNIMDAAQNSFISSTSWTERIGPCAAMAVLKKYEQYNIPSKLVSIGKAVKSVWKDAAKATGINIKISGLDPLAHLTFTDKDPMAQSTVFTQEMLERGFLAGKSFYAMFAHELDDVDEYGDACREVFGIIASATAKNNLRNLINGDLAHSGFKRLT